MTEETVVQDVHRPLGGTPSDPSGAAVAPPQQPWVHDLALVLAAPTQAWSGADGQVRPDGVQGFHARRPPVRPRVRR